MPPAIPGGKAVILDFSIRIDSDTIGICQEKNEAMKLINLRYFPGLP
jgi:hypothetical protein